MLVGSWYDNKIEKLNGLRQRERSNNTGSVNICQILSEVLLIILVFKIDLITANIHIHVQINVELYTVIAHVYCATKLGRS